MKEKIKDKLKNSSVFKGGVAFFCAMAIFAVGYMVGAVANINVHIPWIQEVVATTESTTEPTTTEPTTTEPTTTEPSTTEAPTTEQATTEEEIDSICDFVSSVFGVSLPF